MRSKTNHAKSVLPPPGFSPRRITSPGGIDGRGVSNQIRASGNASSQCAAFNRAVGKMIAVLAAPSVSARSTNSHANANGELHTTLNRPAIVGAGAVNLLAAQVDFTGAFAA